MATTLIQGDYRDHYLDIGRHDCIFADPPDNIGLGYDGYEDKLPVHEYRAWLRDMVQRFTSIAPIVWLSFNSLWSSAIGRFVDEFLERNTDWTYKECVQVFTFGQHSNHKLGNNHRPLWLIHHKDAVFYPDAIRVESWRQRHGDKRASAKGRVPGDVFDMQYPSYEANKIGSWLSAALEDPNACDEFKRDILAWFETTPGDVFDFPRVTGNSKQRCDWHPTQLHLDLVKRCIEYSTLPGDSVFDPFAGTGSTARVCESTGRDCVTTELDGEYCRQLAKELDLRIADIAGAWKSRNA